MGDLGQVVYTRVKDLLCTEKLEGRYRLGHIRTGTIQPLTGIYSRTTEVPTNSFFFVFFDIKSTLCPESV